MTTKTDLGSITLTGSEISAGAAKGAHPVNLLNQAKQDAVELAQLLNTLIGMIPAGSNATSLSTIRNALL